MIEYDIQFVLTVTTSNTYKLVGKRVFPLSAPEDVTWPFVIYQRIDCDRSQGQSAGGYNGLNGARVQYTCYSEASYLEAGSVSDAIRYDLINFINQQLPSSFLYTACFQNERDVDAPPMHGQEKPFYGRQIDIVLYHREAVAPNQPPQLI